MAIAIVKAALIPGATSPRGASTVRPASLPTATVTTTGKLTIAKPASIPQATQAH